mgnify:CR=1 FL=1
MPNLYIDQSTLDEYRKALRQGRTLEFRAGQLRIDADQLATLPGLPQWKTVPPVDAEPTFDLWSCDRLDGVL